MAQQNEIDNLKDIIEKQANDEGLWFQSKYITEAYLQKELRKLHRAIEDMLETYNGTTP